MSSEAKDISASELELLTTEDTYILELTILVESFQKPLNVWFLKGKEAGNQPDRDTKIINFVKGNSNPDYCLERLMYEENVDIMAVVFMSVTLILEFNKVFRVDIANAIENANRNQIATTFQKYAQFFKMYTTYLANYSKANAMLTDLRKYDTRFNSFITACELQPQCNGRSIDSYLILPVQRIPRYKLLLQEIKKSCTTEEDKALFQEAIDNVHKAAMAINQNMTTIDLQDRLRTLQKAFDLNSTPIAYPGNALLKEGHLFKICRDGRKQFYFVLCTNVLFYGREVGQNKYKLSHIYSLTDIQFIWSVPSSTTGSERTVSGGDVSFILRTVEKGVEKAFEIHSSSPQLLQSWCDNIFKAVAAMKSQLKVKVLNNAIQTTGLGVGGNSNTTPVGCNTRPSSLVMVSSHASSNSYSTPLGLASSNVTPYISQSSTSPQIAVAYHSPNTSTPTSTIIVPITFRSAFCVWRYDQADMSHGKLPPVIKYYFDTSKLPESCLEGGIILYQELSSITANQYDDIMLSSASPLSSTLLTTSAEKATRRLSNTFTNMFKRTTTTAVATSATSPTINTGTATNITSSDSSAAHAPSSIATVSQSHILGANIDTTATIMTRTRGQGSSSDVEGEDSADRNMKCGTSKDSDIVVSRNIATLEDLTNEFDDINAMEKKTPKNIKPPKPLLTPKAVDVKNVVGKNEKMGFDEDGSATAGGGMKVPMHSDRTYNGSDANTLPAFPSSGIYAHSDAGDGGAGSAVSSTHFTPPRFPTTSSLSADRYSTSVSGTASMRLSHGDYGDSGNGGYNGGSGYNGSGYNGSGYNGSGYNGGRDATNARSSVSRSGEKTRPPSTQMGANNSTNSNYKTEHDQLEKRYRQWQQFIVEPTKQPVLERNDTSYYNSYISTSSYDPNQRYRNSTPSYQYEASNMSTGDLASSGVAANRILPPGWEIKLDPLSGVEYYIDHNTQTTHFSLPPRK